MKNKYGIGFLLFLILVVFGITCAYQLSLNKESVKSRPK